MTRIVVWFLYRRVEGVLEGFKCGTRAAQLPHWSVVIHLFAQLTQY
jgi:hypothetical protein